MTDIEKENKEIKEKKKIKNKSEFSLDEGVEVLPSPNRTLPNLIEELLEKNFNVVLSKDGYFVNGFYSLSTNGKKGYVFIQDTTERNVLVAYDHKGNPSAIKNFNDLVKFNSQIWSVFYKLEEHKKPDMFWFPYMLELGVLNISPK